MTNPKEPCLSTLENKLELRLPTPETAIFPQWEHIDEYSLYVKRDDLIHNTISGNKWRKLKYQLKKFLTDNSDKAHIVSFGGGYSNHIHALAHCCSKLGIKMTAIIRGNYQDRLTPMLHDISNLGTDIKYVTKIEYKERNNPAHLEALKKQYPSALIIPEGGSHKLAIPGLAELVQEFNRDYDIVVCPVASAGTLAGLIKACPSITQIHGIAMLKGQDYLEQETVTLFQEATRNDNWRIHHDFHCGGYAKRPADLVKFCREFMLQTQIPVEPTYSGKMFYGLKQLIQQKYFSKGAKILALHTGGLQGDRANDFQ
ncbi:pyridoxal-phosphate dependent enzyme [Alteromonadaceae bacterium M269]|nr:pyridoxal-phosphate dependent enzyme [Alteromonadaceae bacterium M269]